jgi:MFS family permease
MNAPSTLTRQRIISKPIWILSLVSLFTDISSEMLYPVMPIFLKSIGFSILLISILEGVAEFTAGFSKGYFGQMSDHSGRRVPFIRLGYLLSALSKPMMALWSFPLWIFGARTADRLGKGIRTGARDAYLSDCTTPEHKGKVFGFHRALDTVGACIGPLVALIFLYFLPGQYRWLFFLAVVPGVISISFTFFLKEKRRSADTPPRQKTSFFGFLKYFRTAPREYRMLVFGLLAFTLFNSSDVFLLLRMKDVGLSDDQTILVYIFYNLIYAIAAYPMGMLGDKMGLKKTFITGLILFALVYGGMVFVFNLWSGLALFFIYGIYAASTESISKAWISNISKKTETATAIGAFTSLNSLLTMLASFLAGIIWTVGGAKYTFALTAIATIIITVYFVIMVPYKTRAVNS